MRISDYLEISLQQLLKHPVRTILTVLGISIGIASMITVLSVGESGHESINRELDKFGVNRIWIYSNELVNGRGSLTVSDVTLLQERIPDIDVIAPVSYTTGTLASEQTSFLTDIAGTTEKLNALEGMEMVCGRFLTENDISQRRKNIVLSKTVAEQLFTEAENAIGETVYLNDCAFHVVGVRNDTGLVAQFLPSKCYIPLDLFFDLFQTSVVDEITFTSKHLDRIDQLNEDAVSVMVNRHGINGVRSLNLSKELGQANKILDIFKTVLAAIAAVSLVVGGIGIMNIMLITVKERTKEIGIKKALGATDRNIMGQFLSESLIYSLLGGVSGVFLGALFTYLSYFIIGIYTSISLLSVILGFLFCAGVGLVFGVVPAIKAGKLDPVLALRS